MKFIVNLNKIIRKSYLREIFIYGIVGGGAWSLQSLIYWIAVDLGLYPSISMMLGNFAGFLLAYYGHNQFTFKKKSFNQGEFIKFAAASIVTLIINVLSVRVITKILLLNPKYAILPTILTPGISFLISKFWAFR